MGGIAIVVGLGLAIAVIVASQKVPATRVPGVIAALIIVVMSVLFSSLRYVGESDVGIVVKNAMGPQLPPGKIIATAGEMGAQAAVLPPGWHLWYWPVIFDVETVRIIQIQDGQIGLITTTDGKPLPTGVIYAPEWSEEEFQGMLNAEYFLTDGGGYKGPQASVLTPGKHRLNTRLYNVKIVPITDIEKATVGVVKSNVGEAVTDILEGGIVERGQRGIWRQPLLPQKYYLHSEALQVTVVSTEAQVVRYTKAAASGEESEITVRSADGFTFPVDVRVEYEIKPENAATVVARFSGNLQLLADRLNSAVRAIFRNNAETVKALDYVQQRSRQESQSLAMLAQEMIKVGLTITAVRIGDVGDEQTLGTLLKTQTDREIARQEQATFQEQQRAAEQKKALTRTEQEAEEERRLATARYEVQIAEQDKDRRIIQATAEAEAIRIRAEAQAEAYRVVAMQIGPGNAALLELLKIVGEGGINITPRVMVVGGGNGGTAGSSATTALIGTMLDTMLSRSEVPAGESERTQR
ncbi:MAG: hypothetical protein IID28_15790 [Planctomycetes bacterium]|nr:hypothetical protein [Planctomycetota bacterium]